MSMMSEVFIDIQEMLESGATRGQIASELISNYPSLSSREAMRLIIGAQQSLADDESENFDSDLQHALFTGE